MLRRSTALSLVPIAVLVTACSSFLGETPAGTASGEDSSSTSDDEPSTTAESTSTGCIRFTGDHSSAVDTGALATDALYLSGEAFVCADDVVVVSEGDLNEVAAAAQLAAAVSGPLLFPDPRLPAELGRLDAARVHIIGDPVVNVPSGAVSVEHDTTSAVDLARELLGANDEIRLPSTPDASTIVETVLAIDSRDRVTLPQTTPGSTTPSDTNLVESEIVGGLAIPSDSTSVWLVDAAKPQTILMAAAVGRALGASIVAIDGGDLLGYPEVGVALDGRPADATRFVGGAPEGSDWELAVLRSGQQLPGGGFYILPDDEKRRYLAYYGHPETEALGVLGEQGPAETLQEMQGFLAAYAGDGSTVIPTFEMIASVASAGPTEDGDYSYEWPIETFHPWVDHAAENEMYVMLDLQSGRDDFLSQAVQYQELLELPYVGLALDPEWRLTPDQVHLEQVGSVGAAEVNEVVVWLADLVRDNGLPQKMMIVHQFRTSMIQNRQDLIQRPEIQMIIQMDGDGTEPQKDATWQQLLQGADDVHWAWGWKNFFDEDEPGPPSPESTMGKVPSPVYVSYQ
ncbi:MAG TPA: hypothetical protein VMM14_08430 [Acidimicrobiia bacterium]|nr:hypothetical protein [Acidimicrobiia bacterium]